MPEIMDAKEHNTSSGLLAINRLIEGKITVGCSRSVGGRVRKQEA